MSISNSSLDGSAAASMARVEKIISNQDILITLCAEFESELFGVKSVSTEESRQKKKWRQSRLNELRAYIYETIEMATDLKAAMNGTGNPLPPTERPLEDLERAGSEYDNISIPRDSDEYFNAPNEGVVWNPITVCNGGEMGHFPRLPL
ncbi:hypothetical protein R1sor_010318 [Riccia sorocarpa]|uniref:Uncharacterized protein n=1 Tax=Riccia sorocarpa TaxID=122646 RepID=A0ABD3HXN4_9MARC